MLGRGVVPLLVAGCLLVPLADLGVWTQRVVLEADEFTALSDDLLEREEVRDALAFEIVQEVERTRPGVTQSGVPVEALVSEALATPEFRGLFRDANGRVHDQLTEGGDALTLDLDPALAVVTAEVRQVSPEVADQFPSAEEFGEIVLVQRNQAPYVWIGVEAARWGSLIAVILALGLLALAVAIADRRGLTLGIAGAGVVVASVLFALSVTGAQAYAARWVPDGPNRAGFEATWDVIESSLLVQTLLVALVGVAAAAAGFLIELARTPPTRPSI
ncbi:MAG TPA: hypothetical protein VMQ81_08120 [Acidimicrobiia bacterium]|nr:hypothetical protein [Acidimicrobiia bacterium]